MNTDDTRERIRTLEDKIDSLIVSIAREVADREHYTGLVEKHDSADLGDIFRHLARVETSHQELLDAKLSELQSELEELKRKE